VGGAQPAGGQAPAAKRAARRFRWASPATATILGVLALVFAVATATLTGLAHQLTIGGLVSVSVLVVIYAGVGLVVARRQPRNPIGWMLLIFTLFYLFDGGAAYYAVLHYRLGYRGLPFAPAAVLLDTLQAPSFALFPPIILLFPDGRLPSRRWRLVLWAYAGLAAYATAVFVAPAIAAGASHDIRLDASGNLTNTGQLAGWLADPPVWLFGPVVALIAVIGLSFAARQAVSWRRAAGERRQQLKWLACGATIAVIAIPLAALLGSGAPIVGIAALPVSIGVGILKYRLYEIDRIISRTLAYALVTGLLVGVYAGLVLLATQVLGLHSTVSVAVATLAAAALFTPLRRRVQRVVDQRFNRARYDADRTVAAFAGRLQDAVDLDMIRSDLATVVQQALEPASLSMWTNEPAEPARPERRTPRWPETAHSG
jgi:hypothetical protein